MIRENVNYNKRHRNEEGRLPVVEEIRAMSQRNVRCNYEGLEKGKVTERLLFLSRLLFIFIF